jgi:hypothetical protein
MKIVDLISVEQKSVVLGSSNVATFFLDTAEEFGVEEGDIILARGVNELYFGIAHLEKLIMNGEERLIWTIRDVKMNWHFCNLK